MSHIRLIAGVYGGRSIDAPRADNTATHPMGERVRNAMFNRIGAEINGAYVLDAFAGTGAIGLEAISRGASHATFVERNKIAQKIIAGNVALLGVQEQTALIRTTINNWLQTAAPDEFDIIFADPPYHDPQLSTVMQLFRLLKPNGLMVLSNPGRGEVPNLNKLGIVVVDNRSYGNAFLTSFRREG